MHADRKLSHRLSARRLAVVAGLSLVVAAAPGCVSDRYVGGLGNGAYTNRGYGFTLRLDRDGLDTRWRVIDPQHPEDAPPSARVDVRDEPLDLDGDGELLLGETTRYLTPTLRLVSRTSSATDVSIDVEIMSGKSRKYPLDGLVLPEVRRRTGTASIAGDLRARQVSGFEARVVETPPGPGRRVYRIAVIDQRDLIAEEGIRRRQLVKVVLAAPALTYQLRKDFDTILSALYLSRRAAEPTDQERW